MHRTFIDEASGARYVFLDIANRDRRPGDNLRTAAIAIIAIAAALVCSTGQAATAAPTTSFTLSGAVGVAGTYDLAALQILPATTETVTYLSGPNPVTNTFTGPTIWTLLQSAGGIATDPSIRNSLLRNYVVATGSDKYKAVISTGEIAPRFGHKPDLIAYADMLGQLGVGGEDGFARLVVPGDIAGGRYVSNLTSFTIFDATQVPEPAAIYMLRAGLVAMTAIGGLSGRRA